MSHVSPQSTYFTVFGTLMVLTAVTVAAAFTNLGALNFPVALAIAVTKATVVVLFFMHVKYSSRLTKFVVVSCLFFLACLFGLTFTDYLSRGWLASPRGTTMAGTQVTVGAEPPPTAPAPEPLSGPAPATGPRR
jgi:cytochrome c oxidase subunit 4